MFPWALFRATKSAVKLHTLLDLRGSIPTFVHVSHGKLGDVNVLDLLLPEPGAFYLMDRACLDFRRLDVLHSAGAFFVIRAKSNTKFRRRYSRDADKPAGVLCDQTVVLTGTTSKNDYPQPLRRVKYRDVATGRTFNFLPTTSSFPRRPFAGGAASPGTGRTGERNHEPTIHSRLGRAATALSTSAHVPGGHHHDILNEADHPPPVVVVYGTPEWRESVECPDGTMALDSRDCLGFDDWNAYREVFVDFAGKRDPTGDPAQTWRRGTDGGYQLCPGEGGPGIGPSGPGRPDAQAIAQYMADCIKNMRYGLAVPHTVTVADGIGEQGLAHCYRNKNTGAATRYETVIDRRQTRNAGELHALLAHEIAHHVPVRRDLRSGARRPRDTPPQHNQAHQVRYGGVPVTGWG